MPKVALVTGSSDREGIGFAIAKALARTGYDVILSGSREDHKVTDLVEEIRRDYKVKTNYIRADLRKEENIEYLCQECNRQFPSGIDILVNNAGFGEVFPIESYPADRYNDLIAVVLSAPFHLIRILLPDMKTKGWGRIINITSVGGVRPSLFMSPYCAAKHGLNGLTKAVAKETAEYGITCNAIMPGVVKTGLTRRGMEMLAEIEGIPTEEMARNFLHDKHPTKQYVLPEDIAEFAVFLCSQSASQLTGSCLPIDGGHTLNTRTDSGSKL
ncbi:D-beta-hydroxybutyrate dehydrogenase-like [Ptychodera flava]|uniref:D-beta-hydroxybutyrate dehydrogenase-like n=1 Tax=Ptychodera flava TaxID=63121 RepID=UPI00396A4CA4